MAAPVIGKRTRFPQRGATVDRTHPLAAGLEFCFVPALGVVELAKGYSASATSGVVPYQTSYGPGVHTPGTNRFTFSGVPDAPFTGALSVLWVGRSTVGSGFGWVGGKHNNSTANNYNIPWVGLFYYGISKFRSVRGGTSTVYDIDTITAGPAANRDYVLVQTCPSTLTTASSGWVNGASDISTATTTGSPTGASQPLHVGSRAVDNLASNVVTNILAFWSRQISEAEAQMLYADPYCFLKW